MLRPERARKRSRFLQTLGQSTVAEAAQRQSLPVSRVSRQDRLPPTAARGGSPTRIDRNTTFSHATLPGLQNFGDLSVAASQAPLELNVSSHQRASGAVLSQTDERRAISHNLLYHDLEKVGNLSEVPGTGEYFRSVSFFHSLLSL